MRLATIEQAQKIDDITQKEYDLSGEVLMESAGAMAAREVDMAYFPELSRGLTAVICGPGNNGGDGLVLARHLHSSGYRHLKIFLAGAKDKRSELFQLQLNRVQKQGLPVVDLNNDETNLAEFREATLVIDALFGIGLARKVEGFFAKVIDAMNAIKSPVVSLDAPSGLDCNRGVVEGAVVKSATTLTFGMAKPGFFVANGPDHVGKLKVVPIGFPLECFRNVATTHFLFNEKLARRYLPSRKDQTNKSDHGHLVVIAGSENMWGAGVLASSAAYRMGVGYVTWASFEEPQEHLLEAPEVLSAKIKDKPWQKKHVKAVAIGPGLGVGSSTSEVLKDLKENFDGMVVVDADAITTAVEEQLFPFPSHWVMTPHSGELSRIINWEPRDIDCNRFAAALETSAKTGCHILLKGFRTVIAYGERCMVINSGNSALAKGGTGDVLTGMIGGMLGQGQDVLQGTATATFLHGRLADEWVRVGNDKRSLVASDLRDHLPQLISRVAGGALSK